jgi:hypothetical protein
MRHWGAADGHDAEAVVVPDLRGSKRALVYLDQADASVLAAKHSAAKRHHYSLDTVRGTIANIASPIARTFLPVATSGYLIHI